MTLKPNISARFRLIMPKNEQSVGIIFEGLTGNFLFAKIFCS